jgi:hypothetical protein
MNKKDTERYILTKFVSNDILKLPVISIKDSETPDFIVQLIKDKKISIEITRLINPEHKKIEAFNNMIVEEAEKLFNNEFDEKLRVLITFSDKVIKCSKSEIGNYAKDVYNIIRQIYLNNKGFEFSVSFDRLNRPYNDYIESLHVDNILNFANWQTFGAFRVDYVDFTWLVNIIKNKENNIKKYIDTFHENWLVMVSNFGTKSSALRFDYINQEKLHSQFDKVYVYKLFDDKVIEVK